MKTTFRCILVATVAFTAAVADPAALGDNAALRYWSAFARLQDTAVSDQQAKELHAILNGTAPTVISNTMPKEHCSPTVTWVSITNSVRTPSSTTFGFR